MRELDNPGSFEKSCYRSHQINTEKVLANRVFRKCLQDLQTLSHAEASKIVIKDIQKTLVPYQKEYDWYIHSYLQYPEATTVMVQYTKNGSPALPCFRYKLFALCLIAGTLELTDVRPTILQLAELAEKQKAEIKKLQRTLAEFSFATSLALGNNQILAAALYGTCPNKDKLAAFVPRYQNKQIVDFEAPATEYDRLVKDGMLKLIPAKDFITVWLFDTITNADFAEIYRLAK
ncbi:MAG: hypothetical protein LBH00_05520 [Planctomycetaceae bacterium]|jgi:hypothetical protein|nr:hypothetical protein [Planctomycetaceae bacterium]